MECTELWAAIMAWAAGTGAKDISKLPGLWHHKTEKRGALGPIDVRLNPHTQEVDGVPPFHVKLSMDEYFPGFIGLVGPKGGTLLHSRAPGEDEAGLVAHFKEQTVGT